MAVLGALGLAILVQVWFFSRADRDDVLRDLAPGLLLVGLLSTAATLRSRRDGAAAVEDDAAVLVADGVALFGLFGCLTVTALGRDPRPLFAALAVALVFVLHTMWRRAWADLALFGLGVAAAFATLWQSAYFGPPDLAFVLPTLAALALGFLATPFALKGRRWRSRTVLWATPALPAFFLAIYRSVVAVWGKGWIGAVPVAMAAVSVGALALAASRFPDGPDALAKALRLRYLALYASVAGSWPRGAAAARPAVDHRRLGRAGRGRLLAVRPAAAPRAQVPGHRAVRGGGHPPHREPRGVPLPAARPAHRQLAALHVRRARAVLLPRRLVAQAERGAARGASPEHDWMPGDRSLSPAFSMLGRCCSSSG